MSFIWRHSDKKVKKLVTINISEQLRITCNKGKEIYTNKKKIFIP